jgi:preprotein translocase subunit SecA
VPISSIQHDGHLKDGNRSDPTTVFPAAPPIDAEQLRQEANTRRLWRPLSHRTELRKETKDLDRYGEWFNGFVARSVRSRRLLRKRARKVVEIADSMRGHSEAALNEEIDTARVTARRGRRDQNVRAHAFAVVREVIRRVTGLELFVEQVMGGWVMEDGCVAEMLTGEGKTITACLTAAVQGWMGYGVHVVTVNDYLARRDAELNSKVYKRLGLTVGIIQHESETPDRRHAYACDVTYTTDQQLIFDFLRDRLRSPLRPRLASLLLEELSDTALMDEGPELWTEDVVHRGLHAAVIDEADSVLIDQATTPAIIGLEGGEDAASDYYRVAAELATKMIRDEDYEVDLNQFRIDLTEKGLRKLDDMADQLPSFWSGPRRREELVNQAIVAQELYEKDDDYIVRDDDVHIVDSHTGRVLEGRQWQMGLHQAIQAKEGIPVTAARQTMARISYQRFFQQYQRLAGMTGTAWETRTELYRSYRLPVVRIPTHKPMIRKHSRDRFFPSEDQKYVAVADRVHEFYKIGRPVLVGTRSVEASEKVSALLTERAVEHRVLNAVKHEEEAAIVAAAGKKYAVTVATNMAGRGTDILLEPGVAEMGGLVVVATERHDSGRVDRQLYGRSGRQGDPGLAETYVSLDDALIETSGVRFLKRWLRKSPVARRFGLSRVLWWQAQRSASRRQATTRELAAKADTWLDRALYYEAR